MLVAPELAPREGLASCPGCFFGLVFLVLGRPGGLVADGDLSLRCRRPARTGLVQRLALGDHTLTAEVDPLLCITAHDGHARSLAPWRCTIASRGALPATSPRRILSSGRRPGGSLPCKPTAWGPPLLFPWKPAPWPRRVQMLSSARSEGRHESERLASLPARGLTQACVCARRARP